MYRDVPYNFGALLMPEGYSVVWHECHEHYQGHGPDDWESPITVDPHQARRWCIARAGKSEARAERHSPEKLDALVDLVRRT